MNSNQIWLIASVALYMIAMLGIGFWTSRRIKSTRDYIVAGNKLGWWLSIGTIFATWFGAETCMGSSRTAFEKGILGVIADPFGAGLCLLISGFFFAKFFHKLGIETIVDFFEIRYGKKAAAVLGLIYIPVYLGWVGGQLLAFGIILHTLTGLPVMPSVLTAAVVVITYTMLGGMWADAVTDLFQMFFILIGLAVLFPILVSDLGGWQAVTARVPAEFFHFYPQGAAASPLDWLNYLQAWMIVGIGSLPAQDLIQRMMSPKTPGMAKGSSILAGFLYIIIGIIPVLIGIFGRAALPGNTGDSILMDLAVKYLPLPLMALMLGALLSAIMSTADSALLAPAGIIGHNMIAYFKPGLSEEAKLRWCRRGIPLVGIVSLVLALYFQNIYTLCTQSWGILLVGVAAPMIAGVYWKKANTCGAFAGAGAGILVWILGCVFLPENYPVNLFGFLVSSAVLVLASLVTQKAPA